MKDNLRIRDGGVGEVHVEGLSEHILKTPEDVKALLRKGSQVRATAETRMNKVYQSSLAQLQTVYTHTGEQ